MDDPDHLNYAVLVPFNGTKPFGGDSLTQDLNIWYEVGSDLFIHLLFLSLPLLFLWLLAL